MVGIPLSTPKVGFSRKRPVTNVRTGLIGEFVFGESLANSAMNSAGAKLAAALAQVSTAPVYSDGTITLGAGCGLDTSIPATPAQTYLAICQADVVDGAAMSGGQFIVAQNSLNDAGRFLICTKSGGSSNPGVSVGGGPSTIPLPNLPARPLTDFRAFAGRIAGTAVGSAYQGDELKGGLLLQSVKATVATDRGTLTSNIEVGNANPVAPGAGYDLRIKHAALLIWNRFITDAELLTAYSDVRTFLAPYLTI